VKRNFPYSNCFCNEPYMQTINTYNYWAPSSNTVTCFQVQTSLLHYLRCLLKNIFLIFLPCIFAFEGSWFISQMHIERWTNIDQNLVNITCDATWLVKMLQSVWFHWRVNLQTCSIKLLSNKRHHHHKSFQLVSIW
jgi:hypothetical protein